MTKCIDTARCTVCGLVSDSINMNLHHAFEGSELCRHNLLKRGTFLEGEALEAVMGDTASCRSANFNAGFHRRKAEKTCIRAYGPHQVIWSLCNNYIIQPSKRGHPLGSDKKRKLHLPPHLCVEEDDMSILDSVFNCLPCPASRYRSCTARCTLCQGRFSSHVG